METDRPSDKVKRSLTVPHSEEKRYIMEAGIICSNHLSIE